jgi:hypothetical protein
MVKNPKGGRMRKPQIYLEARNSLTNQAFASELDEALKTEIRTSRNGEPIRVWEATEREYEFLCSSRSNVPLDFEVYILEPGKKFARRLETEHGKRVKIRAARRMALVIGAALNK